MIPENAFSLPTRGAVIDSRETAEKPGGRYLKVLGRIRPVDPEAPDICFQVNLPEEWNRRLLHFGGGGFDGFLVTGEDKAPSFDPRTLDLRKHRERIQAASRLLDATEADIRPFVKNGGKLMLLHGMMDQVVTPYGTVDYYRRAAEKLGEAETEDALRLYLVPNYGHGIGEHYNMTADLLGVLEDWGLKDIRPEEIHSSDRFPKENGGSYVLKPYRVQAETAETL